MSVLTYECLLSSDRYYSKDEIDSIFGSSYKINFNASLVLKKSELFDKYKNEELLETSVNGKNFTVSKILLKDLLQDDGMYKYLIKNMDNHLGIAVRIAYIVDETTYYSIKLSRSELAASLNEIKKELSDKEKMRLALINSLVSPFSLTQKYATTNYRCNIDGTEILIPATYLIDLFLAPEKEFNSKIDSGSFGYTKEILAYAIINFIERERILHKYIFDSHVIEKYKKISSYNLVDCESLNKVLKTNTINPDGEDLLDSVNVPEFVQIIKGDLIKQGYSPLEIAIYIYFELCNYYSYDEKFFLTKNKSQEESSITTDEFIYLFAKILDELKIRFSIDQSLIYGVTQGQSKLSFRSAEFLVALDSLDNLEKNDLTSVKINDNIIGLKSFNSTNISKTKFNELIDKMYKVFLKDKKRRLDFKSKLEEYKQTYQDCKLSKKEKVKILLLAIARRDLKGIDNIGYMKRIFNNIFVEDKNVTINFIGSSSTQDDFNVTPLVIVTVLDNNQYYYYIIDPKRSDVIDLTSKEELEEMFLKGYYYYCGLNNYIPGLESGEKYVRAC